MLSGLSWTLCGLIIIIIISGGGVALVDTRKVELCGLSLFSPSPSSACYIWWIKQRHVSQFVKKHKYWGSIRKSQRRRREQRGYVRLSCELISYNDYIFNIILYVFLIIDLIFSSIRSAKFINNFPTVVLSFHPIGHPNLTTRTQGLLYPISPRSLSSY